MTNQSLVIQKVHRSHRGRYQCVAFNEQGESISDSLYLKLHQVVNWDKNYNMVFHVMNRYGYDVKSMLNHQTI
ncbi:hypothetical protein BLA29_014593 [Euroglyphus maynei]|uniref:Immunoglobulin I-set domain-containing protein n=1 Tax=Euroglyphus maynei TaxID=6958 RepID=A0A1Y3BQ58_EURMA|nr:hypothetical protein BLA29_014593 [Euroglyphus maynei]